MMAGRGKLTGNIDLTGVDNVLKRLKQVGYDVQSKGGRFALRKASNIVLKAARETAKGFDDPLTARSIEKNLALKWGSRKFKQTGDLSFRVGIRGGARNMEKYGEISGKGTNNKGGDTFYWRFLEFGTKFIRANHFMRDALANNAQAVTDEFIKQYKVALDKAITKAGK